MSRLEALLAAYDRALKDPLTRMPTYLHAAIETARPVAPTNPYAERRSEPRDIGTRGEIGMGTGGTTIRAGQ